MEVYKVIGQMIREKREEKGMTQLELSKELGYGSSQFVSLFERGASKIPHEALGKLIKILGINKTRVFNLIVNKYKANLENELN